MSPKSGVFIAFALDRCPAEALAVVMPWVPNGWSVQATGTAWGTSLVGGPSLLLEKHLIVAGTAVPHPWGVPGDPLDSRALLERFARYGFQVIQLNAGPFVVADAEQGVIAAALNGIVPIFVARGPHTVIGTHQQMVSALAGTSDVTRVPPGAYAVVDGRTCNIAGLTVYESLPLVSHRGVYEDLERHIGKSTSVWKHPSKAFVNASRRFDIRRSRYYLIASPRARTLRTSTSYATLIDALRPEINQLWWDASLRNATLLVPAFERPALDLLNLHTGVR